MSKHAIEVGEEVPCRRCGVPAYVGVEPDVRPGYVEPQCVRCHNEHEETTREVCEHEMRHFGGMYGLPSYRTWALVGLLYDDTDGICYLPEREST